LGLIEREISGVECDNSFGIIVEAKGGGARKARQSPTSHVIAVIGKAAHRQDGKSKVIEQGTRNRDRVIARAPEARYAYYRRCQVFRRNGVQCKAPAETGAQICHAHAGQLAMAVRRERERRAVLAEAVAEMRKRGKPDCAMADLFTDFKGIQLTTAVMARAVIKGTIDCKTAGQMVVHLQTMSKLLWVLHRKGREGRKDLPLIGADNTDLKKLPKAKALPRINADERGLKAKNLPLTNTDNPDLRKTSRPKPLPRINADLADLSKPSAVEKSTVTFFAERKPLYERGRTARILQFSAMTFRDRCPAHGPPELKAA